MVEMGTERLTQTYTTRAARYFMNGSWLDLAFLSRLEPHNCNLVKRLAKGGKPFARSKIFALAGFPYVKMMLHPKKCI